MNSPLQHSIKSLLAQNNMTDSLAVAASEGDEERVRACIHAGESVTSQDEAGWTAIEHAAYRGYFNIVDLIRTAMNESAEGAPGAGRNALHVLSEDKTQVTRPDGTVTNRAEHGDSYIILNLGSLDAEHRGDLVELASPAPSNSSFALEVSATGASGEACLVQIPGSAEVRQTPCVFTSPRVEDARVVFKLYKSHSTARDLVGTGVALVGSLLATAGPGLENVARFHTVPLHETQTLKFIGTVNISLQAVKPHGGRHHAPLQLGPEWSFGNRIGGHRGHGQNKTSWKFLQLGENTLSSFRTAQDRGAAFVEFDVQVTKDKVPVIYHDFLVSETGTDVPMHTLTCDQFMLLSEAQHPRKTHCRAADDLEIDRDRAIEGFESRMSHTLNYQKVGFKPNTHGHFIHEDFTTLKDSFVKLPKDLPFNIEMKYPMLFECRDWQMEPVYMELNLFIDTVLDVVYAHAGDRQILFSSFSPELCIALSLKQGQYPVYFLNDGNAGVADVRASSLQQAVHFARRWNLPGIVMESTCFIECPRLVEYVHSFGLKCATFGGRNNDPKAVEVSCITLSVHCTLIF